MFPDRTTKILHKITPERLIDSCENVMLNFPLDWGFFLLLLVACMGGGRVAHGGEMIWVVCVRVRVHVWLLVHAPHSSGVVSIACSVITSLWKHAQSHTLPANWKAATRTSCWGKCQRQTGVHRAIIWAGKVIFQKNEYEHLLKNYRHGALDARTAAPGAECGCVWQSGPWFIQQSIFCQGYGQVGQSF